MRVKGLIISAAITLALVLALNHRWGSAPPLGAFFSPQQGFWQNAEPVNGRFPGRLRVKGLAGPVQVLMGPRMVPHIFAADDRDAYRVQGYLTAMYRLWQMETQVRAAAGRLSAVIGPATLQFDRMQRRKGMVTAARHSLAAMEADSATKSMLDAYTAGVNAYINTLDYRSLPLEYKLLDYTPEPWTNLKCALLLKYMSDELTGGVHDLENTNTLHRLSRSQFDQVFPDFPDSLFPIIPKGTLFFQPSRLTGESGTPAAVLSDTIGFLPAKPDPDNGSNNWVVNGKKTASGVPILCNDPHLGLNLPSLWFEVQITTPSMQVYGASLPGAPGVIIGFNSFIAWGVTNAQRDVKDYYAIHFRDASMSQYRLDSGWRDASRQIEKIVVRGSKPFYDTVAYTVFGPVTYDPSFPDTITGDPYLATHWAALDSTNEIRTFYLLNHARNYNDFKEALRLYKCPGQNFAYADVSGNIGIWQQGDFPLRHDDEGKFILPGDDSRYLWKGYIPFLENPHVFDPPENYLYSANQNPTDTTYPYTYFGDFIQFRARRIARVLGGSDRLTVQDMMRLQNDYYDAFAAEALPLMLRFLDTAGVSPGDRPYLDSLESWDYRETASSLNPVLFAGWWDSLYHGIWADDLPSGGKVAYRQPTDNTTIEWLLRDSSMPFIDNRNTPGTENLSTLVSVAFTAAMRAVHRVDTQGLNWGSYRGTDIMHLAKIPAFSREHLFTGGTAYTVNAIKKDHGPSWRMIVQMGNPITAYVNYPGGQSGDPGSRYYDDFMDDWVRGKYYPVHLLTAGDTASAFVKYRINFSSN